MLFDNFSGEPGFAYDHEPYGFYHLNLDSECRNAGDNSFVEQDEVDMDGDVRIADMVVDIGADEVSCEDTSHEMDWTADGVINYEEFTLISAAWLSHDPNDPACDPNDPGYISDPNDPGYVDSGDKLRWNSTCNLDDDYDIDLDDLMIFADSENGYWLWQACWRDSQSFGFLYAVSGMSNSAIPEGTLSIDSVSKATSIRSNQDLFTKSLRQQIFEAQDNLNWLETLWLTDPGVRLEIAPKEWQIFMDQIYDGIREMENLHSKSTTLKEVLQ
jgi:hypothetical protein